MITSLPKWIEYGAFILAFVAGSVNAIGLLGFNHQSISHLSGTATLVGTEVLNGASGHIFHLLGVLLSFVLGAAMSGFLLSGSSVKLGRVYDLLLALEGVLLLAAIPLLTDASIAGHYLASAACGLQNALATTYSGAVVRTTHVTGIFTDLGIMLGSTFRGKAFDRRKAVLFLLIIAGFIAGGTGGAYLFFRFSFLALIAPAIICFILAVGYRIYNARTAA